MLRCAGCNKEAEYLVHNHFQPHCESCKNEATDCAVPTVVVRIGGGVVEGEQVKPLKIGGNIKSSGKSGEVVGIDDEGIAIKWEMNSGWPYQDWYDYDELLRYGFEYVEEVRTELAQKDYVRELEESA